MKIERRKFTRYRLPMDTIFFYTNYPSMRGWIKNISFGGTAFEYALVNDHEVEPEITLTLMGDKLPFYLPDIPCKIIYDINIDNNSSKFSRPKARLFGVQYKKLDRDMQDKLAYFLSSEIIIRNLEV